MSAAIVAGLEALIRANLPGAREIVVADLTPVDGGNSSQMWFFEARWIEGRDRVARSLVLRRGAPTEFQSAGREAEFRLLKALEGAALPVPKMLWMDADGRYLERPAMVMERSAGTAHRRLLVDEGSGLDVATRLRLAGEMADLLAAIHAVDVESLGLAGQGSASAAGRLALHEAEIRRLELEPMPELRLASLWLRERLPPPPDRAALVHGDFRPANLLVEHGRITAVLDWEFAHIGDPDEDLGWYLTSYYLDEHLIPNHWQEGDFIARYQAATGRVVDRGVLAFWTTFAIFRLAAMTLAALRSLADGDPSRMAVSADFILDSLMASLAA